jgi:hypothetical protein
MITHDNFTLQFDSTKSHVWIELIGYKSDANLGVQRGKLNLSGYAYCDGLSD